MKTDRTNKTAIVVSNKQLAVPEPLNMVTMTDTFMTLTPAEKQGNKETVQKAVQTIKDTIVHFINDAETKGQESISIDAASLRKVVGELPKSARNEILAKIFQWTLRKDSNVRIISMNVENHSLQFAVVDRYTVEAIEKKVAEKLVSLQ